MTSHFKQKDYVLIAGVFKSSKPFTLEEQAQYEDTLNKMINALANENPRFDQDKFLEYIGEWDLKAV